jgi:hypothetical protein
VLILQENMSYLKNIGIIRLCRVVVQ